MTSIGLPVVGFIGLGEQGVPIAHRILAAGYPMVLWARRHASLDPFRGTRAGCTKSVKDLASRCDMVCLCVLADDDVDEVVRGGLLDGLRPGSLIVVNTTTKPETCRRLAEEAARQQLELIDAPVSGMAQGAIEGKMAIFVGGSTDQFERYEPVAGTFGTPVHTGAVGTGQAVKLLNNITSVCNAVIAQDALVIGRDLGIEPEVMAKAMSAGSAQSRWLDKYIQFGYDPLLGRDPHYFLRDWCRVLSEFQAMLRGQTVGGRLVEELGQVFVERTASHVGRR